MITDEIRMTYASAIRADIPRALLLDILDLFPVAAAQAHAAVSKSGGAVDRGIGLSQARQAKAAGLLRFQVYDEMFEQLLAKHSGECVRQVQIDGKDGRTDATVFLTTGRFGGTLLGFASHRETTDLPLKNASRAALCSLNRGLAPDLLAPLEKFQQSERFALVLIRRHRFDLSKIEGFTISLVDPKIEEFLLQCDLNEFVAEYGAPSMATARTIELKRPSRSFKDKDGSEGPAKTG